MTCLICGSPAYIGLDKVECINPRCEPLSYEGIVEIREMPMPELGAIPYEGAWSYQSIGCSQSPERRHPEPRARGCSSEASELRKVRQLPSMRELEAAE